MNTDIFRYKKYTVTSLLLLSYAFMHVKLTAVYIDASLDKMISFSARLPFGQRLLLPGLAHSIVSVIPLNIAEVFFLLELFFLILFYHANYRLLHLYFDERSSQLLSWVFLLLLPLVAIVNYRLTWNGEANFFYPCDSASLFFMTMGLYLCLRQQWYWFYLLIGIATFNRESAVLLVALVPFIYWPSLNNKRQVLFISTLIYLLSRLLVICCTQHFPGTYMEWFFRLSPFTLFTANYVWFVERGGLLLIIYCLAALPLIGFSLYDYIPPEFRRLRYLAFAYFLGLMLVGVAMESRIYHEIMVLLYLPTCLALKNWLDNKPYPRDLSFAGFLQRYGIIISVIVLFLLHKPLNHLLEMIIHV